MERLFVAREARGTGVAQALIGEAEARLGAAGVETAYLECARGNARAAAFYARCGWQFAREDIDRIVLPDGDLDLPILRFEKALVGRGAGAL